MVKALDDAARERVRERDAWTCQRCGSRDYPQWSHIVTREYYCTRWEDDNAVIHCRDCHCWFTNHHTVGIYWFSKKWPERWERINGIVQSGAKANVKQLYEQLTKEKHI
jgi:5-methylcytosine-specific restriction endonuclease McrA